MPLTPGTKLGQYEVVEAIGPGGMGDVYRARDTKLGRDVAIKVLPEEFARDKERLDRFEREARRLGSDTPLSPSAPSVQKPRLHPGRSQRGLAVKPKRL